MLRTFVSEIRTRPWVTLFKGLIVIVIVGAVWAPIVGVIGERTTSSARPAPNPDYDGSAPSTNPDLGTSDPEDTPLSKETAPPGDPLFPLMEEEAAYLEQLIDGKSPDEQLMAVLDEYCPGGDYVGVSDEFNMLAEEFYYAMTAISSGLTMSWPTLFDDAVDAHCGIGITDTAPPQFQDA